MRGIIAGVSVGPKVTAGDAHSGYRDHAGLLQSGDEVVQLTQQRRLVAIANYAHGRRR